MSLRRNIEENKSMEYITLKNSDLKVSRLCMGGCPMGGHGWGKVNEEELVDAVHCAVDRGVNFFDTADTYGLGKSEETLGISLGNRRRDVIIATKFGVRMENGKTYYDNNPEWICNALQASLRRLNTDYIDLYQVHYRDGKTPISAVIEALMDLKKKGYIRHFGLSNIHSEDLKELLPYKGTFISFQDEFSLANRKNEKDMFQIAQELQMTPFTWGSLGQGILTGKYDGNVTFNKNDRRSRLIYENFHGEKLLKNLSIVEVLKNVAVEAGKSVPAAAIRWILDYLPGSVVLAGVKNADQLNGNLQAFGWSLTNEQIERLHKISW